MSTPALQACFRICSVSLVSRPLSGTVTFLFTDIEGSTRLWEQHPEAMQPALARHDEILRAAIESHGGYVVKTTGDGFHAAFARRFTVESDEPIEASDRRLLLFRRR